MAYPSTVTSYTNPNPSDKLNSPSHSSIETAQNTGLTELQTFVGTLSSLQGSLMYDIRAAASNGGGHVQTANKGGTGFTTYTTGDLLVATNTSTLSKLAIGTDGQLLTADSSVAGKVKWATNPAIFSNKIATSGSIQTFGASTIAETSILSVTIPGSTLGVSNAVKAVIFVSDMSTNVNGGSVLIRTQYGSNQTGIATFFPPSDTGTSSIIGKIELNLIGNGSSVLQRSNNALNVSQSRTTLGVVNSVNGILIRGTSSVNTSADQTLGVTLKWQDSSAFNYITIDGYIVEKVA